jgi:hypothetical protein
MARNRKNQSGAVRFVPALKAVLLCTLIGGSAVGYVLQKNKIYELGRQFARREAWLEHLKLENKKRADQLATLQMPGMLAERVKELKLGLVPAQTWQNVWLPEPLPEGRTNTIGALLVLGNSVHP